MIARDMAVALSLLAATVHAWLAPGHFGQAWWLGAGFAAAATAQMSWAIAALSGRPHAAAGVALNLGLVAAWLISRTSGLPGLAAEPVGVLDVATVGAELSLCALLVVGRRAQAAGAVCAAFLLSVLASGMGAH